jgi:hypothetical protein
LRNGVFAGKKPFFFLHQQSTCKDGLKKIFDSLYPEYKGELAKVFGKRRPQSFTAKGGFARPVL